MINKINRIILSESNMFLNKRKYDTRIIDNNRLIELFLSHDLDENNDQELRNYIVSLIENNQWEKQNPKLFRESLLKSKHSLMLTDYTESELSKMKLFKVIGYNIGYALKSHDGKPFSEIVAVHNNEPNVSDIGNILIQSAIRNGGCYLDHFDVPILNKIYGSNGFVEYYKEKYNPEYDENGLFKKTYGERDIIFRKLSSC